MMYKVHTLRDIEIRKLEWQYTGVAPWLVLVEWCEHNCKGKWHQKFETIYFEDAADYTWFALKWL